MSIAQEKQKVNRKSQKNRKAIENNFKEMFHMENNRGRKKKEVSYDSPFAARLRKLLADTKTTQPMLAEAIGVSRQAIGQWKDGNTLPDVVALGRIAEYFNVSADYLLGLSDVKSIDPDKQINIACEYTGLSEESVTILHDTAQNEDFKMINKTISGFVVKLIKPYLFHGKIQAALMDICQIEERDLPDSLYEKLISAAYSHGFCLFNLNEVTEYWKTKLASIVCSASKEAFEEEFNKYLE